MQRSVNVFSERSINPTTYFTNQSFLRDLWLSRAFYLQLRDMSSFSKWRKQIALRFAHISSVYNGSFCLFQTERLTHNRLRQRRLLVKHISYGAKKKCASDYLRPPIVTDDYPAVSFFTKSIFPQSRMTIRFLAAREVLNALTSLDAICWGVPQQECFATRFIGCLVISAGPRQTVSTIPCGVDRYLNFVLWSVTQGLVYSVVGLDIA